MKNLKQITTTTIKTTTTTIKTTTTTIKTTTQFSLYVLKIQEVKQQKDFFKKYASKGLSPKCRNPLEVRKIRDEIEERIKELVAEITTITPTER